MNEIHLICFHYYFFFIIIYGFTEIICKQITFATLRNKTHTYICICKTENKLIHIDTYEYFNNYFL